MCVCVCMRVCHCFCINVGVHTIEKEGELRAFAADIQ